MVNLKSETVKKLGFKTKQRCITVEDARVLGQSLIYAADEAEDHQACHYCVINDENDVLTMELVISPFMENFTEKQEFNINLSY